MATKRKPAVKTVSRKPATGKPATKKAVARKAPAKPRAVKKAVVKRPVARKRAAPGVLRKTSGEALRLAGIGTDAVAKATGKAWDQWLAVLDKAGAVAMPHKAIASMLSNKYGVPPWWSQMVTVGYEQARGMREAYQKSDGYSASATRTMQVTLDRLYGAWADPKLRELWMGAPPVTVRRSTDGKSMRITWAAGESNVDVNFYPAGEGKSRVEVEHGKLADSKSRAEKKSFWSGALQRLKAMLEKAA
jgi:uncharacterized protein YndB with AHSA1/START domain